MSFLSGLRQFGRTLLHVAPAVLPYIPGMPPELVPIAQTAIADAEALEPVDGESKTARNTRQKAHAIGLVNDAIVAHNLKHGPDRQINQAAAIVAVNEGIDATVRAIKVVHEAQGNASAGGAGV